jgi:hypothetical protein
MAAFTPFQPAAKSGSAGQTVSFSATSTSQNAIIDSTGSFNPSILVTVDAPQTAVPFVRLSAEASTVITATNTDVPMPGGPNACVRLFANPSPAGKAAVAVICTITGSAVNIWFTPGQGGVF